MSSWSTCQVLQPPAFRKYNLHWAFEALCICICICVRHCHRQLIPDIIPRQQNTRRRKNWDWLNCKLLWLFKCWNMQIQFKTFINICMIPWEIWCNTQNKYSFASEQKYSHINLTEPSGHSTGNLLLRSKMLLSKLVRAIDHPYLKGKGGRLMNNARKGMQVKIE